MRFATGPTEPCRILGILGRNLARFAGKSWFTVFYRDNARSIQKFAPYGQSFYGNDFMSKDFAH
jgi:hypothetical protein